MWNNIINKILFSLALLFLVAVPIVKAEDAPNLSDSVNTAEAQVLKILNTAEVDRENGQKTTQQDLQLGILSGPLKGEKVEYHGISEVDVVTSNIYRVNDKVIVSYSRGTDGKYVFFVTDYVRSRGLQWLLFVFIAIVIAVGGKKGFMALLSLFVSFLVIMKLLVPLVIKGYDPLLVGMLMSLVIMLAIIYITEGWNRKSHVAILSITISLLVTGILSIIFTNLNRLTGTSQEETTYILDAVKQVINFKNLLLASFVIGTLGVLDDVVIGQIESVNQIKEANPNLGIWTVFKMSMEIGKSHLSAIINTLFLAYVSASFPLILLFSLQNPPFLTFGQIVNNEEVATEIVRTLVGVIGLCAAVPIATVCAVKFINPVKNLSKHGHQH